MDKIDWHQRFLVQAQWTEPLRQFLYQQVGINSQSRVLEVGCGTGIIASEINSAFSCSAFGIDLKLDRTLQASQYSPSCHFACADAYRLPFSSASMDVVVCHFLLLWLREPTHAVEEGLRILKPGGTFIALAEPDHLARIDHPTSLWKLGELQTQSLIHQGANPMMGRMVPEVFSTAGLKEIQYGISGFQTCAKETPAWLESEWQTLENDLKEDVTHVDIERFKILDHITRENGSRVLWVPTFYAYGRKPD